MFRTPPQGSPEWRGLPVQLLPHQLHQTYMQRMHALLMDCLTLHPRWSVFRIDLRVPEGGSLPPGAITDFIESMKSQMAHAQATKYAAGKRGYDPMLRYVREWNGADFPHYHVALLLNRDAYFSLGITVNYSPMNAAMARCLPDVRICKAWGVALRVEWCTALRGVHFPERPVSPLQIRNADYQQQLIGVLYCLSYFAKFQTKLYGDGQRNFGMSQLRRIQTEHP